MDDPNSRAGSGDQSGGHEADFWVFYLAMIRECGMFWVPRPELEWPSSLPASIRPAAMRASSSSTSAAVGYGPSCIARSTADGDPARRSGMSSTSEINRSRASCWMLLRCADDSLKAPRKVVRHFDTQVRHRPVLLFSHCNRGGRRRQADLWGVILQT
jgi:hypothetical protein